MVVSVEGEGIFAKTAKTRKRRGTPRRYVLRETGESVLNRRIPKGGTLQKPRMGSIFIGAFPFLRVERFQSCDLIYRRP